MTVSVQKGLRWSKPHRCVKILQIVFVGHWNWKVRVRVPFLGDAAAWQQDRFLQVSSKDSKGKSKDYPLVMTNIAIVKIAHLRWIFPLKMVDFP